MAGKRRYESRGVARQVEAFLDAHPYAPLTVAVGFASVRGLAWLAERTAARPVTLVIGNCRRNNFAKAGAADRAAAIAFLERDDVTLKNWYRKRPTPAEAHLKVWVTHTENGSAALVGSANLTGAGLFRNWEMAAEPAPSDLPRVVREVAQLVEQALDAKARVTEYVRCSQAGQYSGKGSSPPNRRKAPPPRRTPRGCLTGLLRLTGWASLLTAAVAALSLAAGRLP